MVMNQSASAPAVTETNKRDDRGRPYNCGADVMHQTGLVLRQGKVRNDLTAMTKQEMPEKDRTGYWKHRQIRICVRLLHHTTRSV